MRVGEALVLRHEDIDAASTVIRIRKRHNSNGARVEKRATHMLSDSMSGRQRHPSSVTVT